MKTITIMIALTALLLAGCATTLYVCEDGSQVEDAALCDDDTEPVPEPETGETTTQEGLVLDDQCLGITWGRAMVLATDGCEGTPIQGAAYRVCNEQTRTIWIDLDLEREGCSPACVIDVDTEETEINWRCTGAIPPEEEEIEKDVEEDVQALLDESKTAVKSYSYEYYGPGPYDEIVTIYVKDALQKLVYRAPIEYNGLEFDTVYLDSLVKKGVGYCEDIYRGPCVNPNYEFGASFVDFEYKLPEAWVDEVIVAKEVSSEYIGNRNALKLEITTNTGKGEMWIDDFYGMPVKVIIDDVEWEYRNMVFNSVTNEELKHSHIQPRPEVE